MTFAATEAEATVTSVAATKTPAPTSTAEETLIVSTATATQRRRTRNSQMKLYCDCQKAYNKTDESIMIECSNKKNCKNLYSNAWYHIECIGIDPVIVLKDYSKTSTPWYCNECNEGSPPAQGRPLCQKPITLVENKRKLKRSNAMIEK